MRKDISILKIDQQLSQKKKKTSGVQIGLVSELVNHNRIK